jgi:cytochrome P450
MDQSLVPAGSTAQKRPRSARNRLWRSAPAMLIKVIRNPIETLPREAFHAPLVHGYLLGRERFHLLEPAIIQEALVGNADALAKGPELQRALGAVLGQGLLTGDGAHWRWQRQSAAPIFRHERLTGFLPAMLAAARRTRDRWLAAAPGRPIDVGAAMMETTFDIIVETMLSGRANVDVARVGRAVTHYLDATGWMFALSLLGAPVWTPFPGRGRARAAGIYLRGEITRITGERRAAGAETADLIGLLLTASDPETGRAMTDGEVTDNLLTFIAAGHETTAQALAWCFDLLARHPACEDRVVAEIARVTSGAELAPEHIGRLAYTRQAFQEAMRLYPPAPIIARAATRPFRLANFSVPAGAMIYVPIYALHRHTALWDDPEAFDPDRFAPDAVAARHRYAYLPFGAGPRICIGSGFAMLEGVAILATLLQATRLRPVAAKPPKPRMRLTLRPAAPLMMTIANRRD